ncbi:MAG TPA: GNAT family N-acetyltransferase [Kofleriaceae bacterium]|nr:GNAT family N-acetyltransferase [Kofleriaceae bacterium]
MRSVGLDELRASAGAFDDVVAATSDIDYFCSSSAWVLPAHDALMGERLPWIVRGDTGWGAFAIARRGDGRFLEPLELSWGLACPLVGRDPDALAEAFVAAAAANRTWDGMLLAGLAPGGAMERALVRAMPSTWRKGHGAESARDVARLDGGLDGFLSRRSRNFRKALRASERDCEREGITFEELVVRDVPAADAAMARIVAIENRSWKGMAGVGVDQGAMHDFYAAMVRLMAPRGQMRLVMARRGEEDVGFVLGGVFAGVYRGLQFSHDVTLRHLSLGNVLQRQQIERLAAEGVLGYDLGSTMEYKQRWSDGPFVTRLLVVLR